LEIFWNIPTQGDGHFLGTSIGAGGSVRECLTIDLPRPCDPDLRAADPVFLGYREHLSRLLREDRRAEGIAA
jgi:hypothetical protein